jgi:PAS domain-containing protein
MKIVIRKNPEIDMGRIDVSYASVVCDITLHDCPIIYVSEIFERLTGYHKNEIKGRNCRFSSHRKRRLRQVHVESSWTMTRSII